MRLRRRKWSDTRETLYERSWLFPRDFVTISILVLVLERSSRPIYGTHYTRKKRGTSRRRTANETRTGKVVYRARGPLATRRRGEGGNGGLVAVGGGTLPPRGTASRNHLPNLFAHTTRGGSFRVIYVVFPTGRKPLSSTFRGKNINTYIHTHDDDEIRVYNSRRTRRNARERREIAHAECRVNDVVVHKSSSPVRPSAGCNIVKTIVANAF